VSGPLRTLLEFGLGWAERDVEIIPLIPGTNRPVINDWPNARSKDPAVIRKWAEDHPGCGWGGLTGSVNHHALGLVIDVDTRRGDGLADLLRWLASGNLVIPATMSAHTPNGGLHIYLATPPGVMVPTRHLDNVDFQGDGGHCVALPPTRARLKPRSWPPPEWAPGHDQLYRMLRPGRPLYPGESERRLPELYGVYQLAGPPRVAPCPPALLQALGALPSRSAGSPNGGDGGSGGSIGDLDELPPTAYLLEHGVPDGMGHDNTLARLAARLAAEGKAEAEAYETWRAVADKTEDRNDPFTSGDFRRHWKGAVRKEFGVTELTPGQVQWAQGTVSATPGDGVLAGTVMQPPSVIDKKGGLLADTAARWVLGQGPLMWGADNKLWAYEHGTWVPGEEKEHDVVHARVHRLLGERYRGAHETNIREVIRARAGYLRCEAVPDVINFRNGLLRWREGDQLRPHDPAVLTTAQMAVKWNPVATCPRFDAFLAEVLMPGDASRLWEVLGYLMMSGNPLHKIILLFGRGFNGKGVLLRTITAVLGQDNVSSVSLHSLAEDRFTRVMLMGRIANLCGDIDATYIEKTGLLKQLTGEDLVSAEHKFRDATQFYNWAVPVFSANEMPTSSDTSLGWRERWETFTFPRTFDGHDPELEPALRQESELEGIAAKGVAALRDLMSRRPPAFTRTAAGDAAKAEFTARQDPLALWMAECCWAFSDQRCWTDRRNAFAGYRAWCEESGLRNPRKRQEIYALLKERFGETRHDGWPGYPGLWLMNGTSKGRGPG
jgi:P4 family phage/plasmid primase-like protien